MPRVKLGSWTCPKCEMVWEQDVWDVKFGHSPDRYATDCAIRTCDVRGCIRCMHGCPGCREQFCEAHAKDHNLDHVFEGPHESSYLDERMAGVPNANIIYLRVIKEAAHRNTPDGFRIVTCNAEEWKFIAEVVNQGIDAHLEAFTKSTFGVSTPVDELSRAMRGNDGHATIHPDEMHIFVRRMDEIICRTKHDGKECKKDASRCSGEGYCTAGTRESFFSSVISALFTKEEEE